MRDMHDESCKYELCRGKQADLLLRRKKENVSRNIKTVAKLKALGLHIMCSYEDLC